MSQIPALRPRKIIPENAINIVWQDDGERASSFSHANKRNNYVATEPQTVEIPQWTVQNENDKENFFNSQNTILNIKMSIILLSTSWMKMMNAF